METGGEARIKASPIARRLAAEQGIDDSELEAAIRAGVERAIDDAQDAGQINPLIAQGLRTIAQNLPVEQVIELINNAPGIFDDAAGLLDNLGGILGDGGDLLDGIFGRN